MPDEWVRGFFVGACYRTLAELRNGDWARSCGYCAARYTAVARFLLAIGEPLP